MNTTESGLKTALRCWTSRFFDFKSQADAREVWCGLLSSISLFLIGYVIFEASDLYRISYDWVSDWITSEYPEKRWLVAEVVNEANFRLGLGLGFLVSPFAIMQFSLMMRHLNYKHWDKFLSLGIMLVIAITIMIYPYLTDSREYYLRPKYTISFNTIKSIVITQTIYLAIISFLPSKRT